MNPASIIAAEIATAAALHDVPEVEIRGYDRRPHVVAARFDAIRAAHALGVPMAEIGRQMGRDHSTISHAVRRLPRHDTSGIIKESVTEGKP